MPYDTDEPGMTPANPGPPGTLLFENAEVRVWQLILAPGESTLWHIHPYEHMLIVYSGCKLNTLFAGGEPAEYDFGDQQTLYVPRSLTPEVAHNISTDRTLRELIVDFKSAKVDASVMEGFSFFDKTVGQAMTTRRDLIGAYR